MIPDAGIKRKIRSEMEEFIAGYISKNGLPDYWRNPVLGYADAKCQYVRDLKRIVSEDHYMPEDHLSDPKIIISYFLPFREGVCKSNIGGRSPSAEWADSYAVTNEMAVHLNRHIADTVMDMGYRAAVPKDAGMQQDLKSRWSQRHIARAAGIGTFGLNNMLIGEKGCCGRYFSVVTDLPMVPDGIIDEENCLFRKDGSCGICAKRCISGSISREGFDRALCKATMLEVARPGATIDICGKCVTGLPCTSRRP